MSTYTVKEFAKVVNMSDRTVRRYIKKGETPQGQKWRRPAKKDGQYVLTDSDVEQWTDDKAISHLGQTGGKVSKQAPEILYLIDKYSQLEKEYRETLLLRGREQTALEKDLESVKDRYNQTATEKKQLEMKLQEIEQELRNSRAENEKLKNRTFWQRLFSKPI